MNIDPSHLVARLGSCVFALVASVVVANHAHAQSDEVLYVVPGNGLAWGAIAPERAQSRSFGTFGALGNHIALGDWLGTGGRQLGVVALDPTSRKIVWRLA